MDSLEYFPLSLVRSPLLVAFLLDLMFTGTYTSIGDYSSEMGNVICCYFQRVIVDHQESDFKLLQFHNSIVHMNLRVNPIVPFGMRNFNYSGLQTLGGHIVVSPTFTTCY
jgi:hypothetical protein